MLDYKQDEQLRRLLRLKKLEVPSDERWQLFDRTFEDRRLSAIKESNVRKIFAHLPIVLNFKRTIFASVAVLLVSVVSTVAFKNSGTMSALRMAEEIGHRYVEFANNDMFTRNVDIDKSGTYNVSYAYDGIDYVQDPLVLQNDASLLLARM
jgi:hypothetical protein